MSQSEQVNEACAALAKAQGQMKAAAYNRVNPHFKNKYADLAAVWEAIRKPLADNGLSVTQTMDHTDGNWYLTTTLHHASGQFIRSYYPLPSGSKPQEMGSALTYARRYSLSAIVGIASDEDDDANAASEKPSVGSGAIPPAAGKPLTREQIDAIEFYVKELSVERVRAFLNWMNIKTMIQITQDNYDRAIAGLKKATGLDLGAGAGGSKGDNQAVAPETANEPAAAQ